MKKEKRNWTPVVQGKVYCSPGCGAGCTYAAYLKALRTAATLAKKLGPGWEPRVWENLGWHYAADRGDFHIHVSSNSSTRKISTRKYFCLVGPDTSGSFSDPLEAVEDVRKTMFSKIRLLNLRLAYEKRDGS